MTAMVFHQSYVTQRHSLLMFTDTLFHYSVMAFCIVCLLAEIIRKNKSMIHNSVQIQSWLQTFEAIYTPVSSEICDLCEIWTILVCQLFCFSKERNKVCRLLFFMCVV